MSSQLKGEKGWRMQDKDTPGRRTGGEAVKGKGCCQVLDENGSQEDKQRTEKGVCDDAENYFHTPKF